MFNIGEDDVWWAGSDVVRNRPCFAVLDTCSQGWVVGHSYIVYAPLLTGCTSILYEGKPVGTPDPGAIFRVISQHKVKSMFTAPTALRAIKKLIRCAVCVECSLFLAERTPRGLT